MAPELPGDPGEDDVRASPQRIFVPMASDESDNEPSDIYDGYQPLSMNEDPTDEVQDSNNIMEENSDESLDAPATFIDSAENTNLPKVESADAEIERQVWSEPRPKELQLELDNTRTTLILNAMANFTLPNVVIPDWATGVPEESWKEELLQRIRQRREAATEQCQLVTDKAKPTSL